MQNGAAPETVRHSRAEHSFYTLPLRFQKYVADYLTPLERVRFFVPRPRMLSVRNITISMQAITMNSAELVKDASIPPILSGMSGLIMNCSIGL